MIIFFIKNDAFFHEVDFLIWSRSRFWLSIGLNLTIVQCLYVHHWVMVL